MQVQWDYIAELSAYTTSCQINHFRYLKLLKVYRKSLAHTSLWIDLFCVQKPFCQAGSIANGKHAICKWAIYIRPLIGHIPMVYGPDGIPDSHDPLKGTIS